MSKKRNGFSHYVKNKELFFLGLLMLMIAVAIVIVAVQLHSADESQIMTPVYQNQTQNHGFRTS